MNALEAFVSNNDKSNKGTPDYINLSDFNYCRETLNKAFRRILFRPECRHFHKLCEQSLKMLCVTTSDWHSLKKHIKQVKKSMAKTKEEAKRKEEELTARKNEEIKYVLNLPEEYLAILALNCCKKYTIFATKREENEIKSEGKQEKDKQTKEKKDKMEENNNTGLSSALKKLTKKLTEINNNSDILLKNKNLTNNNNKLIPSLKVLPLQYTAKSSLINVCYGRLLDKYLISMISLEGKRNYHSTLISKIFSQSWIFEFDNNLVDLLISKFTYNESVFSSCYGNIIEYLYSLSIKNNRTYYENVLVKILSRLDIILTKDNKLFSLFIISLPYITQACFNKVLSYCNSSDKITLGLSTLRDIILKRCNYSDKCLHELLSFTTSPKNELSRPATKVVINKLYNISKFKNIIEEFGINKFKSIVNIPVSNTKSNEYMRQWLRQQTQLYLALCAKNCNLFKMIDINSNNYGIFFDTYRKLNKNTQKLLNNLSDIENLIKHYGSKTGPIMNLIKDCPYDCQLFVYKIAKELSYKTLIPNEPLMKALYECYSNSNNRYNKSSVIIFLPVLKWIPSTYILNLLPQLLSQLDDILCKQAINSILKKHNTFEITQCQNIFSGCDINSHYTSIVDPVKLLVTIQCLAPTVEDKLIKNALNMTNYCLGQGFIYNKERLATVLQQLVDKTPIPVLLMRTLIIALKMFKDLTNFALDILKKLIQKEVWKNNHLWEGFIRCVIMTRPKSYPIVLGLPKTELQSILHSKPELRKELLNYANKYRDDLRQYVFDVLNPKKNNKKEKNIVNIKTENKIKSKIEKKENISNINNNTRNNRKRFRNEIESKNDMLPYSKRRGIETIDGNIKSIGVINNNKKIKNEIKNQIKNEIKNENKIIEYKFCFELSKYKSTTNSNDLAKFLLVNFANLLKIDKEHIRQVKISKNKKTNNANIEMYFKNVKLKNNKLMIDVIKQFEQQLKTYDFTNWELEISQAYFDTINIYYDKNDKKKYNKKDKKSKKDKKNKKNKYKNDKNKRNKRKNCYPRSNSNNSSINNNKNNKNNKNKKRSNKDNKKRKRKRRYSSDDYDSTYSSSSLLSLSSSLSSLLSSSSSLSSQSSQSSLSSRD